MIKTVDDLWAALGAAQHLQEEGFYDTTRPEDFPRIGSVFLDLVDRKQLATLDGLTASYIYGSLWSLIESSLRESDFQGSTMVNVIAVGADFSEAYLGGSHWMGSSFRRSSLRGADLSFAHFKKCSFECADFRHAILHRTWFENCSFDRALWEDAQGRDPFFEHCFFTSTYRLGQNVPDGEGETARIEKQVVQLLNNNATAQAEFTSRIAAALTGAQLHS